jgi:RecG-like helicase
MVMSNEIFCSYFKYLDPIYKVADLIVVDEAHKFSHEKTTNFKRLKNFLEVYKPKVLMMTGTALQNES